MTTATQQDLEFIPLDQISPSPTNPRKTFDDAKLKELAESIMTKGLIQPIVVRPHVNGAGTKFEVVAGERRYRASKLAGLRTILCIVRELEDVAVLELQTIENL
jgi:ParB family chromosome partitioning protein